MPSFRTTTDTGVCRGRRGVLETAHGDVQTPAFFPVVNLIGGPTTRSGGIWSRTRNRLFENPHFQGAMFQAMSFLDFGISPDSLETWRSQPLHDHFTSREGRDGEPTPPDFTQPLFVDSGGFKLLNSTTFGGPPGEDGEENEWGIYTNPESILDLQLDYGADIIATLDYPIPPDLREEERTQRMEDSIDSAIECLQLLQKRDADPAVYVAIHGHDHETINWYVGNFLSQAGALADLIEGFAIGSLVPIRNNVEMLVDIVTGAKDAIPAGREDDLAIHVFGVGGRFCSLLALLGVDSFDSSSYIQASQYKKFIHPQTWEKFPADELSTDWDCDCRACRDLDVEKMQRVLYSDESYQEIEGMMKSDFYALIAEHNFEVYHDEVQQIRDCIDSDDPTALLDYVVSHARNNVDLIQEGLEYAQKWDTELGEILREYGYDDLIRTYQTTLPGTGVPAEQDDSRTISLQMTADDFNILSNDYHPPAEKSTLVIIPCSQRKPYGESRTHRAVFDKFGSSRDDIHKVTVSGLYGPVPEEYETADPVMTYDYVLTDVEESQKQLVISRLVEYLQRYGDQYETIVGYAVSKTYRHVIEQAFDEYGGNTTLYPTDPQMLRLTEHFRESNIMELLDHVTDGAYSEQNTDSDTR